MACACCLSSEKNETCYTRSININWIYYNLLSSKAHYSVLLTTEMYKGQTEHVFHVQHFALLFKSIRASIKAKTKNTWRLKTFRSIETNWNIFLTNLQQKNTLPPPRATPPFCKQTEKKKQNRKKRKWKTNTQGLSNISCHHFCSNFLGINTGLGKKNFFFSFCVFFFLLLSEKCIHLQKYTPAAGNR